MSLSKPCLKKRQRAFRLIHYVPLLPICLAANANCAQAQLIEQYIPDDIPGYAPDLSGSVLNRMYVQQDPAGVEIGDIVIRPALSENTGYNTNTLGNADSGSSALESNAGLRVDSDWTRNSLGLSFEADNLKYFEVPAASYTNFVAGAAGSLDLGNDMLKLSYAHSALNIASTDLGVAGVTSPVPYSIDNVKITYVKQFSRCSLIPAFAFENFGFGQSAGAASVNYSSLDHHVEIESLAGRLEPMPGDAGILLLRFALAQFQNTGADDYTDEAGFIGLDFRGDPILQLRALLGLEQRNFSGTGENPITLPSFEISAVWMPTELDTLTVSATRRIDDPTSPFALDATILDGELALYHELRSDVFCAGSAEIQRSRLEFGNAALNNVNQTGLNLGLKLIWDISTHLSGTISYAYNDTASENGPATASTGQYPNFNSHTILIGISLYE
jgi:hypothetical protein